MGTFRCERTSCVRSLRSAAQLNQCSGEQPLAGVQLSARHDDHVSYPPVCAFPPPLSRLRQGLESQDAAGWQSFDLSGYTGEHVTLISLVIKGTGSGAPGFKLLDARFMGTPIDNPSDTFYVSGEELFGVTSPHVLGGVASPAACSRRNPLGDVVLRAENQSPMYLLWSFTPCQMALLFFVVRVIDGGPEWVRWLGAKSSRKGF